MRRLFPRTILGQLALLILVAFLAAQAMGVWLFAGERGKAVLTAQRIETVERAASVARLLAAAPAPQRPVIVDAASSRLVRFALAREPIVSRRQAVAARPHVHVRAILGDESARDIRIDDVPLSPHSGHRHAPPRLIEHMRGHMAEAGIAPVEMRLSIPLDDGEWLNVTSRVLHPEIQLPPAILGTTLVSLTLLMAALWFGLRRITGPLQRLAQAADDFGAEGSAPAMPKTGPSEVQALAEALERMQERVARMVADRTRMLAALGHDLRSPITALRVRVEMVEDDETRDRMICTLDEMQEMVEATLAYARGVSTDQPPERVDLAALVEELAAELSELGPEIHVSASGPIVLPMRRMAVRRALRNVLENAQRYGHGARVALDAGDARVRVVVEDAGPGIPEADLERVFDPYLRLETSRSRETGGTGLGLPIARAILRAHGGDMHLSNLPAGGLRATVSLPRRPAAAP